MIDKLAISYRGLKLIKTYDVSKYIDEMSEKDKRLYLSQNFFFKNLIIENYKDNNYFFDISNKGFVYILLRGNVFEYSVYIKDEFQKKMTAYNAVLALTFYMFDILNMKKMETNVYSNNKASLKIQFGFFELEGIIRQTFFDGKYYYDKFLFGMLKDDFTKKSSKLKKYFRMIGNKETYK